MTQPKTIAERFVTARLDATPLSEYPGVIPNRLDDAYAIQDEAIRRWPDTIGGWKVGRIAPPWLERFGEERLVGPIFTHAIERATPGESFEFPMFTGGFAAVEAEYICRLGADAPHDKTDWTPAEAAGLIDQMLVGVEIASSPLATINELGPSVVVSDFGNNFGLILGFEVSDWRARLNTSLTCEVFIEGKSVGRGGAASIPGGPFSAAAFALARNARRGRPMRQGDLISTGAASGIHDIKAGERSRVVFTGIGEVLCHAVPAGRRGL